MRSIVAVCLLAFTLSACSGATPTPVQIPVTVEVTRIVTIPVTVVVTATPLPTDTPVPTATAKPKPPIPAGWKTYTLVNGDLTFAYPPDWRMISETSEGAVLENRLDTLFVIADIAPATQTSERVRRTKTLISDSFVGGNVTFEADSNAGDYPIVSAVVDKPGTDVGTTVIATYVLDGHQGALVGSQGITMRRVYTAGSDIAVQNDAEEAARQSEITSIISQVARSVTFSP